MSWSTPTDVPRRPVRLGTILSYSHARDRYLVLPQGITAPRWIKGIALRSAIGPESPRTTPCAKRAPR